MSNVLECEVVGMEENNLKFVFGKVFDISGHRRCVVVGLNQNIRKGKSLSVNTRRN
jgi:hypothetical protein